VQAILKEAFMNVMRIEIKAFVMRAVLGEIATK
jgi:hypothetical protein